MRKFVLFGALSLVIFAKAALAVPEVREPKEFVSRGITEDLVIDHVRLVAREGKARYRVHLGTCDAGEVSVDAYLVPGYREQVDVITLSSREGSMLFAATLPGGMSEFVFAQRIIGVSGDGKEVAREDDNRFTERHFSMGESLIMLRTVAPNLFAAYMNELSADQRDTLREERVLKQSDTFPLPSDCRLNDLDKASIEKWEKLPQ